MAEKLKESGLTAIEYSGGINEEDVLIKLLNIEKEGCKVQIHNYFPVPKKSFVLNIGSSNKKIRERSRSHMRESISIASKLKTKRYSFHAGFFVDPDETMLGKAWSELRPDSSNYATFIQEVRELKEYAEGLGVELYVENNVVIDSNISKGKCLLMGCSMKEMIDIKKECGVKILVDVGHLVVSAKTLGLNEEYELEQSRKEADAYHISDNNRKRDENKKIVRNSVTMRGIGINKDFYTVEVYEEIDQIEESIKEIGGYLERLIKEREGMENTVRN